MTSDHAFGSDQLTPELLRSATFDEHDGRVDAAEVRQFLDRVASSLEVFMSEDAPTALRAEFSRNAEIAQQILNAGQNAAEQLRRQAAEEAKRILDEARDATLGLRETVEGEIEQARDQVEAMRGTFIQDLRDLYDRIGASLYRFERAAEESSAAPIQEPTRGVERQVPEQGTGASVPDPEERNDDALADWGGGGAPEEPELPEGAKPPAWRQLPPEAWASNTATGDDPEQPSGADGTWQEPEESDGTPQEPEEPAAAPASPAPEQAPEPPVAAAEPNPDPAPAGGADPFAVVEDEPLAPGEPLVDLRDLGAATPPTADALAAENPATPPTADAGGSWLDAGASDAAAAQPAAPTQPDAGGSWLDAPAVPAEADVARDDALAEALIAGQPPVPDAGSDPGASAIPPLAPAAAVPPPPVEAAAAMPAASPDATAVRQQILDLLASGQSRENIEAYLSQQLGLLNPGALVDAALGPQP